MKKKKGIWILTILVFFFVGVFILAYNYYTPASERPVYTCIQHQDDTLRLAMIGDSWVFFHYPYNEALASIIKQKIKKPVKVSAYGQCGKTSKEVYQSIFEDQTMRNLLEQGADYCFVSVGINDTYKKMGAEYYAQSTSHILSFLIQNDIKPILLDIPDYDINYAYEHQTSERKLLRQLSMIITLSKIDCRQDYRLALIQEIGKSGIDNDITILKLPYSAEYYKPDWMHLNDKGYQILDSCIAKQVLSPL
jgi:lysophospholipase L1-like esterase